MKGLDFELIDLPIEFKEINPEDFDNRYYHVSDKIIIQANQEGYISDKIIEVLKPSIDEKTTVVINAGVGQGKTTAVIQLVKEYSENEDYIIVLAVPYNSLIQQYQESIVNEADVCQSQIFSLLDIEDMNFPYKVSKTELMGYGYTSDSLFQNVFKVSNYKVHIMTVNGLLGNSGENNLFQSKKRESYYSKLITYCKKKDKKLIVFFDEIHDGVHNFKEEFVYKLWRYQGVIHKNFIVSATFNEASKEVIKYLSEFTERKIQILESERKIIPKKQSRLHLIFQDSGDLNNNKSFDNLLSKLIINRKTFDVIVYSKKQISNLVNLIDSREYAKDSGIKKHINLCYNDMFDINANKRYEPGKINIGTNFTTGVNITTENHTLIIILPKRLDSHYLDNRGVFTTGANAIIQTLARQRKVGDIYVIMSPPLNIEAGTLLYSESINQDIVSVFNKYKESVLTKKVNYININSQDEFLNQLYKSLKERVKQAKANIKPFDRTGLNKLRFPPKEIFILQKGEKYLTHNFFGGDLSSYVFWASIAGQFQNCKLTSINKIDAVHYQRIFLYQVLVGNYNEIVNSLPIGEEEGYYLNIFSEYRLYNDLEEKTIGDKSVTIDNQRAVKKELDLIRLFILNIVVFEDTIQEAKNDNEEVKRIREQLYKYYLRSSVKHSLLLDFNQECQIELELGGVYQLEKSICEVVLLLKEWEELITLIGNSVSEHRGKRFLPTKPSNEFKQIFLNKNIKENLLGLIARDRFLSTDIFPFKDTISKYKRTGDDDKIIEYYYKLIIDLVFEVERGQISREGAYVIKSTYDIESINFKNLLYDTIPEHVL